jgi:hypothetical protein
MLTEAILMSPGLLRPLGVRVAVLEFTWTPSAPHLD